MSEINHEIICMQIATILNRYRFETRGYSVQELLDRWLPTYSLDWIRMAVLEALYQGRYKVISVEEILKIWQRRGQPTYHFTHEFERLVCKNLPGGMGEKRESADRDRPAIDPRRNEEDTPPMQESKPVKERILWLEAKVFDDPRKSLSDVGELFSRLTVEPAQVIEAIERTNGNGANGNGHSSQGSIPDHREKSNGNGVTGHSIHEFTPLLDGSELYSKLKAVARSNFGDRLT
jgi:hypothetical protein